MRRPALSGAALKRSRMTSRRLPLRAFHGGDADLRRKRIPLALRAEAAHARAVAGGRPPRAVASLVALLTGILWLALELAVMADDWSGACRSRDDRRRSHRHRLRPLRGRRICSGGGAGRVLAFGPARTDGRRRRPSHQRLVACQPWPRSATPRCRPAPKAFCIARTTPSHLLMAGAWIGGLIPSRCASSAYGDDDLRADAVRAMTGFSFWDSRLPPRSCSPRRSTLR